MASTYLSVGQPVLNVLEIPTKVPANKDGAVIAADLIVDGTAWIITCVSMGNPHCITFGSKQCQILKVDDLNLSEIGPKFENHTMFPARINTEFVQVFSRTHIKMSLGTWCRRNFCLWYWDLCRCCCSSFRRTF